MRFSSSFIVLAAVLAGQSAFATTYHLVDLGKDTTAAGINSLNQVAGTADGHGALYADGKWHERKNIHHGSRAMAIDHDGNMIGAEFDADHRIYPMYYPAGERAGVRIPLPDGSLYADPTAASLGSLSADGLQAAGTYQEVLAGNNLHCFQWTPGAAAAVDIGLPDGYATCEAFDINKSGDIVGRVGGSPTGSAAFVYHDGVFTLSGADTHALLVGVNVAGHAVGLDFDREALFWDGAALTAIAKQGKLKMTTAEALNANDDVAGIGTDGHRGAILLLSGGVLTDIVPLIDDQQGLELRDNSSISAITDAGVIIGSAGKKNSLHGFMLIPQ